MRALRKVPFEKVPLAARQRPFEVVGDQRFDDHDSAMVNSALPETDDFAAKQAALLQGAPSFLDLDVLDDED